MEQTQQQALTQRLMLTQTILSSLSLLKMDAAALALVIIEEARRNPFIRALPSGAPVGGVPSPYDNNGPQEQIEDKGTPEILSQQISLIRLSTEERALADDLVHCLDERGILCDTAEEICRYLNTDRALLMDVVTTLQDAIEPVGVFAWSLRDCFALQLRAANRYDVLISRLLDHLELVATADIEGICIQCGVDREDAEEMLNDIRMLSPAPLRPMPALSDVSRPPDLIFRCGADGSVTAELNEGAVPVVLTDDAMFSAIAAVETDAAARQYYRDCYRGAAALVVALQKRANTLLRLGQQIARVQARFIKTGRALDLRPLTMSDLAQELRLSKSTVSRALDGCLIDSGHGLHPAVWFLPRPLSEESGSRTRDQALQRLSLLIRTEDRHAPYSDADLARQMAKADLRVSRRTIVKYRGLLGLANAHHRRRSRSGL